MNWHIEFPKDMTPQHWAAIVTVLQPALRKAIEEGVEAHGEDARIWFEQLSHTLMTRAKGTVTEGIPMDVEAEGLRLGLRILQATLEACRHDLFSGSR